MVGVAIDTYKNIAARIIASSYKSSIQTSKKITEDRIKPKDKKTDDKNNEEKTNKKNSGDLII